MGTVVLVMGVSGSGKSTVGRALADRLGWVFVDADDHHPPANVEKMGRGVPLDDNDRAPWLTGLAGLVGDRIADGPETVLACSALKRAYRDQLGAGRDGVSLVFLRGRRDTIESRMAARADHYMAPDMLASQLAALEEPSRSEALWVEIEAAVDDQVNRIVMAFGLQRGVERS